MTLKDNMVLLTGVFYIPSDSTIYRKLFKKPLYL